MSRLTRLTPEETAAVKSATSLGRSAFREGIALDQNPFIDEPAPMAAMWRCGWRDAERDVKRVERARLHALNQRVAEVINPPGFKVSRAHALIQTAHSWGDTYPNDERHAPFNEAADVVKGNPSLVVPLAEEGKELDGVHGLGLGLPGLIVAKPGEHREFWRRLHAIALLLEAAHPRFAEEVQEYRGYAPRYASDWNATMKIRDYVVEQAEKRHWDGPWNIFSARLREVVWKRRDGDLGCWESWAHTIPEDFVQAFLLCRFDVTATLVPLESEACPQIGSLGVHTYPASGGGCVSCGAKNPESE